MRPGGGHSYPGRGRAPQSGLQGVLGAGSETIRQDIFSSTAFQMVNVSQQVSGGPSRSGPIRVLGGDKQEAASLWSIAAHSNMKTCTSINPLPAGRSQDGEQI